MTEMSPEEQAFGLTPIEKAAWLLVFNMEEMGNTPKNPWWEQEYLGLKRLLEERGLNTDPEKAHHADVA